MPKVRKAELSFLYVTRRLVLFYISSKYHKSIPKGLWLTERTQNYDLKSGDNAKSKKGRVVILVCDTSSSPVLHFCQVLSKYSKGYSVTEQTRNLFQTKQREITPKLRKPESCHSCTRQVVWSCFIFLPSIIKNIPKASLTYRADTKSMGYHCQI